MWCWSEGLCFCSSKSDIRTFWEGSESEDCNTSGDISRNSVVAESNSDLTNCQIRSSKLDISANCVSTDGEESELDFGVGCALCSTNKSRKCARTNLDIGLALFDIANDSEDISESARNDDSRFGGAGESKDRTCTRVREG